MHFDKAQQNINMDQIPGLPNIFFFFFQSAYTWRMLTFPVMGQICSLRAPACVPGLAQNAFPPTATLTC